MGGCFRSPKTTPWASTLISIQRLRDLDFALVESVLDQPPSTQQRAFLLAKNYLFVRKKRRDHYIREAHRILVNTSNKTLISVVSQPPSTQQRALAFAKMFLFVQRNAEITSFGERFAFWLKQNYYFGRRSCSVRAAVRLPFWRKKHPF